MVKNTIFVNTKNPWIILYSAVFIVVGLTTYFFLNPALNISYILCLVVFYLNIIFSLDSLANNLSSKFFHLFSVILALGFPIKFSAHTIWTYEYLEPIGRFDGSNSSISNVLLVATIGALGMLVAQLIQRKYKIGYIYLEKKSNLDKDIALKFMFILVLAFILSAINLKFNILLFGLTPAVKLPMSGNAVFFLAITRGIMFLLFFYVVDKLSFKWTLWSSLVVLIVSIGVLSRMLTIMFFATIFLNFLKSSKNISIKQVAKYIILLVFMSFVCVKITTSLRIKLYESTTHNNGPSRIIASTYINKITRFIDSYRNMIIDRWIGMEGVMAVEGYNQRGFNLFKDSLFETSYKGNSFYTKIADEKNYNDLKTKSGKIVTSVPGPIAYFYYSGSKTFVFFMMFLSTFLITSIETFFSKKIVEENVSNFIAIFMVFDYFQFGIAPISMIKNWAFTFIILLLFINIKKIKYIIMKSYKHKF